MGGRQLPWSLVRGADCPGLSDFWGPSAALLTKAHRRGEPNSTAHGKMIEETKREPSRADLERPNVPVRKHCFLEDTMRYATLIASLAAAAAAASVAQAAPGPMIRVSPRQLPASVRTTADAARLELCPDSRVSVVHRVDLDGDGDPDYVQDYADVHGCVFSYPMLTVWWNRDGRFVSELRVPAALHRNRHGYAFFHWRCSDQDLWHDFRIDYFDGRGEKHTACIPEARYEAVRTRYGFTFAGVDEHGSRKRD
jgi:hypothetical protein